MDALFGGKSRKLQEQQLMLQEEAQRRAYATSVNAEAQADQELAAGRRRRGGRSLLTFLDGADTLGG